MANQMAYTDNHTSVETGFQDRSQASSMQKWEPESCYAIFGGTTKALDALPVQQLAQGLGLCRKGCNLRYNRQDSVSATGDRAVGS